MKKKIFNLINAFAAAMLCLVILLAGCFGCFGGCDLFKPNTDGTDYEFFFADAQMGMFIGDEKTFTADDFMYEPASPRNFGVTLSAADSSVLAVSGATVKATAAGVTTLTATDAAGKTAECTVEVTSDITSFELVSPSRSVAADSGKAIDVAAVINGGSVAAGRFPVKWTIDGRTDDYKGGIYTISAGAVKQFKIEASVTSGDGTVYTDSITVNRYDATRPVPALTRVSGSIIQEAASPEAVGFKLDYTGTSASATDIIQWLVDGKTAKEGGSTFIYTSDSVGRHTVTALVNGRAATGDDNVVEVAGAVTPTGLKADFDTFYPKVMLSWNAAADDENFLVRVSANGTNAEYSAQGGSVLLDATQVDVFSSDYTFAVKSLGNFGLLRESDYGNSVTINKVDSEAKSYLAKKWFGGNYYITSDDEFFAIYDYFMLYREQPTVISTSAKYSVYMGYSPAVTAMRLSEIAFNRAGYTGSYEIDATKRGNVVTLSFTFKTVSTPSLKNSVSASKSAQLNGISPHVSKTGRANSHVFAAEQWEKSATVSTTDQLYRVLELGYRPSISKSAPAYRYYEYAKSVLNSILDDGMTDIDKVHAIYDWIMWRVLYDDKVGSITDIASAVKYEAFYAESVFTNDDYLAVCDGMSKAFSVLCNLEGIKCIRVTGTAYSGGVKGGHAWNKVMVGGQWYICDCTWGDIQVSVKYKAGISYDREYVRSYEMASHMYFMKTDAEMNATHTEDEDTDYPQTAAVPYNWYNETKLGEGENAFYAYVTGETNLRDFCDKLVDYAASKIASGTNEVITAGSTTQTSDFFAVEIKIADNAAGSVKPALTSNDRNNPLTSALAKKSGLYYNLYSIDNYIILIVSKNVRLS